MPRPRWRRAVARSVDGVKTAGARCERAVGRSHRGHERAGPPPAQGGAGRHLPGAGRLHLLVRPAAVRRPLRDLGRHAHPHAARDCRAGRRVRLEPVHLLDPQRDRHTRAHVAPVDGDDRVDHGGVERRARRRRRGRRAHLLDAGLVGVLEVAVRPCRWSSAASGTTSPSWGCRSWRWPSWRSRESRAGVARRRARRLRWAGGRHRRVRADPAERGIRPAVRARRGPLDVVAAPSGAQGARSRVGTWRSRSSGAGSSGWSASAGWR